MTQLGPGTFTVGGNGANFPINTGGYPPIPVPGYSDSVTACPPGTVGTIQQEKTLPAEDEIDTPYSLSKTTLLVLVFIFVVLLLGFFIALYYAGKIENQFKSLLFSDTTGNPCSGQTCGTGFYCDGNGNCRSGTAENVGEACGSDKDCAFGLTCLSTTKTCGTDPGTTQVSGFTGMQLTTTSSGSKQYLLIDEDGSFLSPTKPEYSYNYSTSSGLSFNTAGSNNQIKNVYENKFVGTEMSGELGIASTSESAIQLIQTSTRDIQLVFAKCQISTGGQSLFFASNPNGSSVSSSTAVSSNQITGSTITNQMNCNTFTSGVGTNLSGMISGMNGITNQTNNAVISKPFIALFQTPANNSSSQVRCPIWPSVSGASIITFQLDSDLVSS